MFFECMYVYLLHICRKYCSDETIKILCDLSKDSICLNQRERIIMAKNNFCFSRNRTSYLKAVKIFLQLISPALLCNVMFVQIESLRDSPSLVNCQRKVKKVVTYDLRDL